jgi:1-aminocyclopropane-1-carboxylate deaminase
MSIPSPVQTLYHPLFEHFKVNVQIKRDDLIDLIVSGNKWRKLKFNIRHAKVHGYKGILSFGGGYSNHIHALAYACKNHHLKSIAIIRGEPHYANNCTLAQAKKWGMTLQFVDRNTYRLRNDESYLQQLQQQFPEYFIVPEGGSNSLALSGVAEICQELINEGVQYDTLITPVGSAGTISGLIIGDKGQHEILGVAVLKQQEYLHEEVVRLLGSTEHESVSYHNWQILVDYHRGGYAKFSQSDLQKIKEFSHITQVPFEPIYSGKMVLAFLDLIEKGYFKKHHRVMLLHTGGLQGLGGLIEQNKLMADEWPLPLGLQAQ